MRFCFVSDKIILIICTASIELEHLFNIYLNILYNNIDFNDRILL